MSISFAGIPSARISAQALALGALGRCVCRQRVAKNVFARQFERVHGGDGDEQGVGRVETARDADDDLVDLRRA